MRGFLSARWKSKGRLKNKRAKARYHKVRAGENLSSLALKYRQKISNLKKWNKLRSGKILVGQVLIVKNPKTLRSYTQKYKVEKGDSLITIAKKFRVSVQSLRRINKIRGDRILRGQYLSIASAK